MGIDMFLIEINIRFSLCSQKPNLIHLYIDNFQINSSDSSISCVLGYLNVKISHFIVRTSGFFLFKLLEMEKLSNHNWKWAGSHSFCQSIGLGCCIPIRDKIFLF